MIYKTHTLSTVEVPELVKNLINNLHNHQFILLNGEIGSGKTFLTKEIAKQLGETSVVTSPSFQIMNVYDKFVHIDAYNLKGGLDQYYDFFEDKIVIIEWSENTNFNFSHAIAINISYVNEKQRLYEIKEVE